MQQSDQHGAHGTADSAAAPRFAVAFQPIVDAAAGRIRAHEALLRGPGGSPAGGVLARVPDPERAAFETTAIDAILRRMAGPDGAADLHVNISPGVLLRRDGVVASLGERLAAAGFPPARLVVEVTEGERIDDTDALKRVIGQARALGLRIALDEFGTGYGGLALLADVDPDMIKLDMTLIRGIHLHRVRRSIVSGILRMAGSLKLDVVAVGVESESEYHCLADLGVTLLQGFLFAAPATERLVAMTDITIPVRRHVPAWVGTVADPMPMPGRPVAAPS
jgi:EAL domain-containing protein (putative c-di-GMP-specific phosphodiesterase class I)